MTPMKNQLYKRQRQGFSAGLGIAALSLFATSTPVWPGNFSPPAGCKLEVTVQNRGCTVSQIYRCDAEPDGHQNSAIFDENGLTHLSQIDAETRWVESSDPITGLADFLVPEAEDQHGFGKTTPQFDCGQMLAMSVMQRAPL